MSPRVKPSRPPRPQETEQGKRKRSPGSQGAGVVGPYRVGGDRFGWEVLCPLRKAARDMFSACLSGPRMRNAGALGRPAQGQGRKAGSGSLGCSQQMENLSLLEGRALNVLFFELRGVLLRYKPNVVVS